MLIYINIKMQLADIKGQLGWLLDGFSGCGGSGRVMGECLVGQWISGVISFQKIVGLYGLKRYIMEYRYDVTIVREDGRWTDGQNLKIELESEFAILFPNLSDTWCSLKQLCFQKHT